MQPDSPGKGKKGTFILLANSYLPEPRSDFSSKGLRMTRRLSRVRIRRSGSTRSPGSKSNLSTYWLCKLDEVFAPLCLKFPHLLNGDETSSERTGGCEDSVSSHIESA